MKQFAPLFRRQTPGVERFRLVHVVLRASLSTLERKQGMLRAILLTALTIWQRNVALSIAMSADPVYFRGPLEPQLLDRLRIFSSDRVGTHGRI